LEEEEIKKKKFSPEQALVKARAYCAYQERCHQEMRDKLYSWGLWPEAVENTIITLIEENFLNEERFAKAYAGGKFRIVGWGRGKIKQALKQKKISDYCIRIALNEIPDKEYRQTLQKILLRKTKEIKEKNPLKKKYKLASYIISRGFEPELVWEIIKEDK
jgi:regulatory protein